MAETQNQNTMNWVLGGALALIGLFVFVALILIRSQADSVSTSTSMIANVAPTIESIFISSTANGGTDDYSSGIALNAGSTTTVHVNGIVQDLNGQADITNVSLVLYQNEDQTSSCTADDNNCYTVAACTIEPSGANSNQQTYDCSVPLNYYADSTDGNGPNALVGSAWTAQVTVDDGTVTDSTPTENVEVNTGLALTIPSSISYPTLALGASTSSSNNIERSFIQQANDLTDVEVSTAAAMSCTVRGTIPVADQQWSLTDISYDATGTTALTTSPVDTNIGLNTDVDDSDASNTDGTDGTRSMWWNITIPASGVEGDCTGTTVISAIAG